MPTPTFDQMKTWARRYVETWNAGDQEAWIANWKAIAPGDFRMLDPVGTPEDLYERCAASVAKYSCSACSRRLSRRPNRSSSQETPNVALY